MQVQRQRQVLHRTGSGRLLQSNRAEEDGSVDVLRRGSAKTYRSVEATSGGGDIAVAATPRILKMNQLHVLG